jgi:hypothetical protein
VRVCGTETLRHLCGEYLSVFFYTIRSISGICMIHFYSNNILISNISEKNVRTTLVFDIC